MQAQKQIELRAQRAGVHFNVMRYANAIVSRNVSRRLIAYQHAKIYLLLCAFVAFNIASTLFFCVLFL